MDNSKDIILKPLITEKSTKLQADNNTVVFQVKKGVNKIHIKQAIEKVLKIKVVSLKTDPQLMGALGAAEYARMKGM